MRHAVYDQDMQQSVSIII